MRLALLGAIFDVKYELYKVGLNFNHNFTLLISCDFYQCHT